MLRRICLPVWVCVSLRTMFDDASTASPAAFRGGAVAAFSGALAVAAHALGGGGLPHSSSLTLLAAACIAVGVLFTRCSRGGGFAVAAALVAGQFVGHLALTVQMPDHAVVPGAAMLVAHGVATIVCAAAVSAAVRLYGPIVAVWRAVFSFRRYRVAVARGSVRSTRHLGPVVAVLHASISRRGPPILV